MARQPINRLNARYFFIRGGPGESDPRVAHRAPAWPRPTPRRSPVRQPPTAYFLIPGWATGRLAFGERFLALGLTLAIFHRLHHPVERYGHRHRLGGDRFL